MAGSFRGFSMLVIGGYALSGCALLPLAEMRPEATSPGGAAADSEADVAPATPAVVNQSQATAAPETPSTTPTPYFNEGVNRAQSAVAIGQSAQSTDDWSLAANRWKQAVLYMQQVPSTDPNYATAQQKVKEYQANLAIAERRAAGEKPPTTANADAQRPPGLVASIPVVNQMGGTPVVPVTLTGNQGSQQFTMLFDTGASGTLITPAMAEAIGVVVVSTAVVTVADGRQVEIPVGYVDTLTVGDLVVRDLLVGIGGDVALLGQDVYGEYGLAIGGSKIDLYE